MRAPGRAGLAGRATLPGMSHTGRGVLVTGASRGVGAATARAFAARGDRVVVHLSLIHI